MSGAYGFPKKEGVFDPTKDQNILKIKQQITEIQGALDMSTLNWKSGNINKVYARPNDSTNDGSIGQLIASTNNTTTRAIKPINAGDTRVYLDEVLSGFKALGKAITLADENSRESKIMTGFADNRQPYTMGCQSVAFSGNGQCMVIGHSSNVTPLSFYEKEGEDWKRIDVTFDSTWVANKYPVAPSISLSYDGTYISWTATTTNILYIFKRTGTVFSRITPATEPAGNVNFVAFSQDVGSTYLAVAHATSPFISIYKRSGDTFTKLSDPANLSDNTCIGLSWSDNGTYLAVSSSSSNTPVLVYKRSGDVFTKLTINNMTFSTGFSVAISPDGTYLFGSINSAGSYVKIWKNNGSDVYNGLSNPSTLPSNVVVGGQFSANGDYLFLRTNGGTIAHVIYKRSGDTFTAIMHVVGAIPSMQSLAISPDGTFFVGAHNGIPYLTIMKRDGDTFPMHYLFSWIDINTPCENSYPLALVTISMVTASGGLWSPVGVPVARSSDIPYLLSYPENSPPYNPQCVAVSGDGTYLAVVNSSQPYLTIYKRVGEKLIKLSHPTDINGAGQSCAFSDDGVYLFVGGNSNPYFHIYKRTGDVFTKLSNPASLPPDCPQNIACSEDGVYIMMALANTSPYINIYKRSGDTFTKQSNPANLPPVGATVGVSASADGVYWVVCSNASPYLTFYKRSGDTFTKLANPTTLPTGISGVCFCDMSRDGVYVVAPDNTSDAGGSVYASVYKRSGDTWTRIAGLNSTNAIRSGAWSEDANRLALSSTDNGAMFLFKRSGDQISPYTTNPVVSTSTSANKVLYTKNGAYLITVEASSPPISLQWRGHQALVKDYNMVFEISASVKVSEFIFWIRRNIVEGSSLRLFLVAYQNDGLTLLAESELTRTAIQPVSDTEQDEQYIGFSSLPNKKFALRIEISKASVTDTITISRILGVAE